MRGLPQLAPTPPSPAGGGGRGRGSNRRGHRMRRRDALLLFATAALWGSAVRAQRSQVYRVGFLSPVGFAAGSTPGQLVDAVIRALARQGRVVGENVEIEKRSAQANYD